jgi:hypothetical protein
VKREALALRDEVTRSLVRRKGGRRVAITSAFGVKYERLREGKRKPQEFLCCPHDKLH